MLSDRSNLLCGSTLEAGCVLLSLKRFRVVLYTGKDCRDSTVAVSMEATWPRVIVPACGPRVNSRKWPDLV